MVLRKYLARTAMGDAVLRRIEPTAEQRIEAALAVLREQWAVPPTDDEPVFVLSSAWRSGSTLLQRLVVSSGTIHLWGEPWARSDPFRRLAESLAPVEAGYPLPENVWDGERASGSELAGTWIANLSPAPAQLIEAHRAFVRTMLAPPVPGHRWGFKEVRLGAPHARYLALLFPRAKFLYIHRDPWEQWRSYRQWRTWFLRWPEGRIRTAHQFGALWRDLTDGMLAATDLDVLIIGYRELLDDPAAADRIGEHLGVEVDRGVLAVKLGASPAVELPAREVRAVARAVGPTAVRLGYSAP